MVQNLKFIVIQYKSYIVNNISHQIIKWLGFYIKYHKMLWLVILMSSRSSMPNDFGLRSKIRGVNEALDSLKESQPGTHCLMVYPDLMTFREIYTRYVKILIEQRNEVVLFLPYYETPDMVRHVLSGRDTFENDKDGGSSSNRNVFSSGINVNKYEKEGSLVIVDSVKGLFGPENDNANINIHTNTNNTLDLMAFLNVLEKHAQKRRKNGVTVLADMGSFYHGGLYYDHPYQKLVKYEKMLFVEKYEGHKNMKGFCLYHQRDFEMRLQNDQQAELLDCHSRNIMLVSAH